MHSPYITRHILSAIEHVRARKARPDLHRICCQLKRRHNCSHLETTRCIDQLLDLGIVIKVQYKGSITYRDATKWKKGHVSGHIINSNGLVAKLQAAIDGVIEMRKAGDDTHASDGRIGDGDQNDQSDASSVSLEEIEEWLQRYNERNADDACMLTGHALFEVITREVEMNTIKKSLDDGRYTVGTRVKVASKVALDSQPSKPCIASQKIISEEEMMCCENIDHDVIPVAEPTAACADDKRQRPPSNRKRIKKYPDELYELPPIKKSRKQVPVPAQNASATSPMPESNIKTEDAPVEEEFRLAAMFRRCNEIHQLEKPSRHEGKEDEMLVCCGCQMKAHPDCMEYSAQLLAQIDRETWRCVTCKNCAVCNCLLRTPSPMTCSGCDLAYHKSCHKPIMRKKPKDNWLCMKCTGMEAKLMSAEKAAQSKDTETAPGSSNHLIDPLQGMEEEYEEEEEEEEVEEEEEEDVDNEDSQDSIPVPPAVKSAKDTAFPPTPRDSPSFEDSCIEKYSASLLRAQVENPYNPQRVQKVSRYDGSRFPDPSQWSVEQVFEFITSLKEDDPVLAEGAEALRRENIDGESLMYLSRDDILNRFSLKVGPALKLFRLVVNMRTNGNAHKFMFVKT